MQSRLLSRRFLWLISAGLISLSVAGCGGPNHLSGWYGGSNHAAALSYYPQSVPNGPPAPAHPVNLLASGSTPPNLPTGGLAAPNGQAARWALGSSGAIIYFVNPGDAEVPWLLHYVWIPAAKKNDVTIDLVDVQAVSRPASFPWSSAYDAPRTPTQMVVPDIVEPPAPPQTLQQMGATIIAAAKAWNLPAWIHLYVISPQTAADWKISTSQGPVMWAAFPTNLFDGNQIPCLAYNGSGFLFSPRSGNTLIKNSLGSY